ncbi:ComEC/Rec2 family competence protein, partial [Actinocorallia lasiicapitis]
RSPDAPPSTARTGRAVALTPGLAGQRWRSGAVELEILGPLTRTRLGADDTGSTINNTSLVIVARWDGLSALLPGDVEEEAQQALIDRVPQVDVLKVPHHGSARQLPPFLAAAHARLALISAGAHNDYGHPAARTLSLLHPTRTERTDLSGDLAVTLTPSGLSTVPHGHPP